MTVALALFGVARIAVAQPAPPVQAARLAEEHYNRGRELTKAGRYQDAAAAFEASQKLDPGWGTLYNLAQCYEHIGKLASAQAMYRELARPDSYPRAASVTAEFDRARRKDAGKRAAALDKRISRLRITVSGASGGPAGLVVTLDGSDAARLIGTDTPIDLGAHQIHASAPGHKDFDTTTTISDEARSVAVVVELSPIEPARVVDTSPDTAPPADHGAPVKPIVTSVGGAAERPVASPPGPAPSSPRRTYGVIAAAGGGVLVATGLVFGQLASSKWTEAQDQCPDKICQNAADLNASVVSEARTRATVSTVLVIGGAVAIVAGVVVYVTAPRAARSTSTVWRITPSAGTDRVSLLLDGRF